MASPHITTGSHTLGWAAALGFRDIILLGIGTNYAEIIGEAKKVKDRDTFPHLCSWKEMSPVLTEHGVLVINANPYSKVNVFPKYSFSEVAVALIHERKTMNAEIQQIFPNRRQEKLLKLFGIVIGPMLRTAHRNKLRNRPALYFAKAKHPVNVVFKKILKIFGPAPQ